VFARVLDGGGGAAVLGDVVARAPEHRAARRDLAGFLAARGLFGEAETQARAVVGADPKDAEGWFVLGEVLRRSGRAEAAAGAYRAAADLRPDNASYRRAAGGGRR
jgi:cytochrome c-type biogenesis protein CcmH/NrfG